MDGRRPAGARGKTAIVVDDGITTGLAMTAAMRDIVRRQPGAIVIAVPVAPRDVIPKLYNYANAVVSAHIPGGFFGAVRSYYEYFPTVSDEEVRSLLGSYRRAPPGELLDLEALNSVIATIGRYPVTSGQMAGEARRLQAPDCVVDFFESIPCEVLFKNKADVIRRSQEAVMIMEQEAAEPAERLDSYDL
jgi:hypothetical protein